MVLKGRCFVLWHDWTSFSEKPESYNVASEPTGSVRRFDVTSCALLSDIDRVVDPSMEIHLVMDNGSSHTANTTKAWLAAHPRFVAHYTPPHASWVNQVELFFSVL